MATRFAAPSGRAVALGDLGGAAGASGAAAMLESTLPQSFSAAVSLLIECALPLAYLHGASPPQVHSDLQPARFRVDSQGNGPPACMSVCLHGCL